jgi:hypothetical protein
MAGKTINAPFVDFNGRKYRPGEEDELAAVLPKRDVEVFAKAGVLEGDWSGAGELPPVRDLADHLADISTIEEVKSLQARDTRKGAAPIYEARIAEIEEQD